MNYFTKADLVKYFHFTRQAVKDIFLCRGFPSEKKFVKGKEMEVIDGDNLIRYLNYMF